ncbi:MAG: glycosyltransferase [Candidatus Viridilinea halotolerans]|uniref:Glycosyltransferase n=1 Tax=Candidatus Viridilinea halotolerans TaxID=2491704 RepID=A0A426TQK0_9CHLR|nr:MAG: glycosyltransferase [Candidatus Viridilinea halotolerans]
MENPSLPSVDVVMATRNRADLVPVAVNSLLASTGVALTIWIVDQSNNDETERVVQALASQDARVRYQHSATPGLSISQNIGSSLGTAPYILYTDDDCRADPGWAAAMVDVLRDEAIWAVFGRIHEDEVTPPTQATPAEAIPGVRLAVKMSTTPVLYHRNRFNLGFGHGASMGLRREVWQRVGGFDEALGAGGPLRSWNDRDIGYRILSLGGQIAYVPQALVYHRQWRDWPAVQRTFRNYGIGAGATAMKYLRYGDLGGFVLLFEWLLSQGVRQILAGVIKWRSWQKTAIGLQQLVMPWYGMWLGWRVPLSREHRVYLVGKR